MEKGQHMTWMKVARNQGISRKRAEVIAHILAEASTSPDGCYMATQAEICEATRTKSPKTVTAAIREGVAAGIIERPARPNTNHSKGGSVYRLAEGDLAA